MYEVDAGAAWCGDADGAYARAGTESSGGSADVSDVLVSGKCYGSGACVASYGYESVVGECK